MAKPAERMMAKAVGRVLARHAMAGAAGFELPFDQFAREVTAEAVRVLEKRAAKDLDRSRAVAGMVSALTSAAGTAGERGFADLDPERVRLMLAVRAPAVAGVPRPGPDPESN